MALGPKQMGEAVIRNLKEKTGKSIEEWIKLLEKSKLQGKKEIINFLKMENGLGHFQALKVFEHYVGEDNYKNPSAFVHKLFDSKKSQELYEFVKLQILEMGNDIRVQPCKTYIPFYRQNQFALLTKSSIDQILLGLNLPENYHHPRFSAKAKVGSERINFQTIVKEKSDFNEEIVAALLVAYQNN